ncbi:MAG: (2Fe-2S) ferredoxin domain-containing protein [bacterium]|nr:(2Fe-2S) ferredoxin domain-containing protein [bacterium]
MKVTVCIGSSCHIKGSRQVVEQLQYLIGRDKLGDKVELGGTFCMGKCQQGVCVTVDEQLHSLTPETTEEFYNKEIKEKVK